MKCISDTKMVLCFLFLCGVENWNVVKKMDIEIVNASKRDDAQSDTVKALMF